MQRFGAPLRSGLPKLCTAFRQVRYLWKIQELFKSDWLSYTRKQGACYFCRKHRHSCTKKNIRGKAWPRELSYHVSILHILGMDTCNTTYKFKEHVSVSVQWTLQYSNETRGTSRTVLLPSRSCHRCPCSDLRPSKPVSAQLLSEVLQHVRYFPIGSHGLPVSVASKLRIIFLPGFVFSALPAD